MNNILSDLINRQGWCVADGATGTNLFARDMGAKIIGGCCGTSPAHVAAMTAALEATPKRLFDEVAMTAALGTAWADVNINNAGGDDRRGRLGRRRSS